MVSKKFANLCKFGKYYPWPAQDCLNWSDRCNLLFLHESMLWINHCKSTLWLNVCAKMWITFNVQNTRKSGWKGSRFFLPLRLGKKLVFFVIISMSQHALAWAYLLSKDQENTLAFYRDIENLKFVFLSHLTIFRFCKHLCVCTKMEEIVAFKQHATIFEELHRRLILCFQMLHLLWLVFMVSSSLGMNIWF